MCQAARGGVGEGKLFYTETIQRSMQQSTNQTDIHPTTLNSMARITLLVVETHLFELDIVKTWKQNSWLDWYISGLFISRQPHRGFCPPPTPCCFVVWGTTYQMLFLHSPLEYWDFTKPKVRAQEPAWLRSFRM